MSNYEFRNGAHIKGVTADQAGDELARIYVEKGELTAPLVVDESRPEEAPLHPAFEWDDAVAAERHREHQARNIIRSVKVITEDKPSEPVYVHVSSAQSYKPVAEVVKCVSMYAEALLAATKQVEQAQHALDVLERHCSDENEPIISDLRLVINNTCDVLKHLLLPNSIYLLLMSRQPGSKKPALRWLCHLGTARSLKSFALTRLRVRAGFAAWLLRNTVQILCGQREPTNQKLGDLRLRMEQAPSRR